MDGATDSDMDRRLAGDRGDCGALSAGASRDADGCGWSWSVGTLRLTGLPAAGEPEAPARPAPSFAGISLKVGALDDAAILAGVTLQRGEWEASRGGEISILEQPLRSNRSRPSTSSSSRHSDWATWSMPARWRPFPNAAVMPPKPAGTRSGRTETGASRIAARPARDDTFQYMDYRSGFPRAGQPLRPRTLALPCGGSALVLVYRRDAFESDGNREAARQAGLSLEAAGDLDAARRPGQVFPGPRLERRRQARSRHRAWRSGRTTEGVGDAVFLARAASLGQHRDHYSFLFDSDAFDSADRHASVRRGAARFGRLEGVRAARAWSGSMPRPRASRFAPARSPC